MKFYVSDLHFGHKNVICYDKRPFQDIEENDRILIENWNQRVGVEDEVYIAGDFAYKNVYPEEWYLSRLNGKKYLIIGNHDQRLLKNQKAMSYFDGVDKMMHVSDEKNQICVCHFPLAEWNGFRKGHWHIYGHIHGRTDGTFHYMKELDKALNAAVCINNYSPVTFTELIENNRKFKEKYKMINRT